MPCHANLPTGFGSYWYPGDIMLYSVYDLYSYEPNKGEILSKFLIYKFEHITMKGRMSVL
jgi:hypothetical protein